MRCQAAQQALPTLQLECSNFHPWQLARLWVLPGMVESLDGLSWLLESLFVRYKRSYLLHYVTNSKLSSILFKSSASCVGTRTWESFGMNFFSEGPGQDTHIRCMPQVTYFLQLSPIPTVIELWIHSWRSPSLKVESQWPPPPLHGTAIWRPNL